MKTACVESKFHEISEENCLITVVNYYSDIKIIIYHPFRALSVSDGKLLSRDQIHNLPLNLGRELPVSNGKLLL